MNWYGPQEEKSFSSQLQFFGYMDISENEL